MEPAIVKLSAPPPCISKKKQEHRLPQPFQLPVNLQSTIADALRNESLSAKSCAKFLSVIADSIFRHKSYPTNDEYEHIAQQIVKKGPFLSKGGSYVSTWILFSVVC